MKRADTLLARSIEEFGIREEDLAAYLSEQTGKHYGQTTVSGWYSGKHIPQDIKTIEILEELTGCRREDLFPEIGNGKKMPPTHVRRDEGVDLFRVGFYQNPALPNEKMLSQELGQQLKAALAALSDTERQVIVLSFGLDGNGSLPYRQIGPKVDKTYGRVGQIRQMALAKMRERLIAEGYGDGFCKVSW